MSSESNKPMGAKVERTELRLTGSCMHALITTREKERMTKHEGRREEKEHYERVSEGE